MKRYITLTSLHALSLIILFCLTGCGTSKLGESGQRKVNGKTYVILGASSGLGRGVAEQLGQYKANVVLAARRTELLEEIATKIRASGGSALVVTTDLSKPEDVTKLRDAAVSQYGKIDVWINMAGVGAIGPFWEIPIEDQARLIDVNLKGFIYGSHAAVSQFQKQKRGVLINIGSIDSEVPNAYQVAYSSSKAAVRSLSLGIGQELRLHDYDHIKVVVIEPWAVDTPFWGHAANYSGKEPKFPLMDEPDKVVNAIIRKSLRPRKIVPVGWKAKGASFFANVAPRAIESITGNIAHKYKIEMPPAAPDTTGSIYEPMKSGVTVEGGVDEKMKRDRKQRKTKK